MILWRMINLLNKALQWGLWVLWNSRFLKILEILNFSWKFKILEILNFWIYSRFHSRSWILELFQDSKITTEILNFWTFSRVHSKSWNLEFKNSRFWIFMWILEFSSGFKIFKILNEILNNSRISKFWNDLRILESSRIQDFKNLELVSKIQDFKISWPVQKFKNSRFQDFRSDSKIQDFKIPG